MPCRDCIQLILFWIYLFSNEHIVNHLSAMTHQIQLELIGMAQHYRLIIQSKFSRIVRSINSNFGLRMSRFKSKGSNE